MQILLGNKDQEHTALADCHMLADVVGQLLGCVFNTGPCRALLLSWGNTLREGVEAVKEMRSGSARLLQRMLSSYYSRRDGDAAAGAYDPITLLLLRRQEAACQVLLDVPVPPGAELLGAVGQQLVGEDGQLQGGQQQHQPDGQASDTTSEEGSDDEDSNDGNGDAPVPKQHTKASERQGYARAPCAVRSTQMLTHTCLLHLCLWVRSAPMPTNQRPSVAMDTTS